MRGWVLKQLQRRKRVKARRILYIISITACLLVSVLVWRGGLIGIGVALFSLLAFLFIIRQIAIRYYINIRDNADLGTVLGQTRKNVANKKLEQIYGYTWIKAIRGYFTRG
jgi:hypothetical protein